MNIKSHKIEEDKGILNHSNIKKNDPNALDKALTHYYYDYIGRKQILMYKDDLLLILD